MANTYLSTGSSSVGTTYGSVYTTPNGETSVIKSIHLSNVGTGTYYASIKTSMSNAGEELTLINSGQIPTKTTLQVIDGTLVLNSRGTISIKADTASVIHATVSVLEIS